MDDPNIAMEEYIMLEEEKARRHGKVYNWETAKYGKIWYDEDVHDLGSVETKFSAIVFNDTLTSDATLSCEPTVSSLNNDEIDFRISFDEFDDEDCTVDMPLLPSPEPTVSYFDALDYFKDFENEFPAIVYNDAPTTKSNLLTEPILSPQHIDEFDLKRTRTESGFKREFVTLFGQDLETFTGTMFLNMDQLEKQLDKEEFQEIGSMATFKIPEFHDTLIQHMESVKKSIDKRALHKREDSWVNERQMQTTEEKVDTSKALDASLVDTKSSGTESKEHDTSSKSRNGANG
ncbi:hypothetical protein Tco_1467151 [Tanacetum coccineum]